MSVSYNGYSLAQANATFKHGNEWLWIRFSFSDEYYKKLFCDEYFKKLFIFMFNNPLPGLVSTKLYFAIYYLAFTE